LQERIVKPLKILNLFARGNKHLHLNEHTLIYKKNASAPSKSSWFSDQKSKNSHEKNSTLTTNVSFTTVLQKSISACFDRSGKAILLAQQ
jgi:hypothetical protein